MIDVIYLELYNGVVYAMNIEVLKYYKIKNSILYKGFKKLGKIKAIHKEQPENFYKREPFVLGHWEADE